MVLQNLESGVDTAGTTQTTRFIEEISILIAAQDLTPTMMSQDFLKFSGIIPKDWELSQQPVLNPNFAQLNFKNGINISAQPRTITVSESLNRKEITDLQVATIVANYVRKLPYAEYVGYGFSPKILLPFPTSPQSVRHYITENLLGRGAWKNIGKAPVQSGINLMYQLERCQLSINISEARLQQNPQQEVLALLFSGNFNYSLAGQKNSLEKTNTLTMFINHWQQDFNQFRTIVTDKFLSSASHSQGESSIGDSVFPGETL